METISDLFNSLEFGKHNAITAEQLHIKTMETIPLTTFKRKLRSLASKARRNGTRIIGDDNGYYISANIEEWYNYKKLRFAAIKEELESFASCERISTKDLIKEVYYIQIENPNYELNI